MNHYSHSINFFHCARPELVEGFLRALEYNPSTRPSPRLRRAGGCLLLSNVEASGRAREILRPVGIISIIVCILMGTIALPHPIPTTITRYYHDFQKQCNDFIIYCYAIKCLSESGYFLSRLDKYNYCYHCNCINQKDCIQIDSTSFFNKKVKLCIQKMHLTKSLKPILPLLQEIKNCYHDQNNQFLHELSLLVFTIHKQILLQECKEKPHALKNNTLETILEISNKINQLPIAEVLNAIDMLVTELPPFLEKYELHSKITWKNWLKKYWWVPPVFGIWFGLRILLSLQRHQFYYSSYSPYSPKPQIHLQPIVTSDPQLLEISREKN